MPKILIVDDTAELTELYQIIFSKSHYDLTVVSSREKLIRQLVLNRPDIIMMDILLNGEDGRKICKELKLNKDFKDIPILLTSGHTEKLSTYEEYLADDYLEKPFDVITLLDKVKFFFDLGAKKRRTNG